MKIDTVLELEGLTGSIKLEYRWLSIGDELYFLHARERDIMQFFMKRPNRVWSAKEITGSIWGPEYSTANSKHHIMKLRAKIEKDPHNPRFVRSVGRGAGMGGYVLVTDPKKEAALDKIFLRSGEYRKK